MNGFSGVKSSGQREFLELVKAGCAEWPHLMGDVVNAATESSMRSVERTVRDANERAADFEVIAISMHSLVGRKYSKDFSDTVKGLVLDKLSRWKGKSSFTCVDRIMETIDEES